MSLVSASGSDGRECVKLCRFPGPNGPAYRIRGENGLQVGLTVARESETV
jgi:hypothetical protein